MKNIHVIILGILVVFLAVLFGAATLNSTKKYRFKVSAPEMLGRISAENHFITPASFAGHTSGGALVVDVRDPKSFSSNPLANSINIPFERLLDDENLELFKDGKAKILCCNDGGLSNSAWMILNQFDIRNLKVLEGGIDAWKLYVDHKEIFSDKPQDDEAIKFDLKKMNGIDTSSVSDDSTGKSGIKTSVQKRN